MKEIIKCCMCGKPPEDKITRQNEKVKIYFADIKTKETLCEKDNQINDGIYRNNGKRTMGVMKILTWKDFIVEDVKRKNIWQDGILENI